MQAECDLGSQVVRHPRDFTLGLSGKTESNLLRRTQGANTSGVPTPSGPLACSSLRPEEPQSRRGCLALLPLASAWALLVPPKQSRCLGIGWEESVLRTRT